MGYKMKGFSGFKQSCGCDGKCMCSSPAKLKLKKSTESAHGQLGDAEREYQEDLKAIKRENLDHIGTGFMNPPYKDTVKRQKQGVPYAKRQGYHGFKNFDSILKDKK